MMKKIMLVSVVCFLNACASLDKVMTGSSLMPAASERAEILKADKELDSKQRASYEAGEVPIGISKDKVSALFRNELEKCRVATTVSGRTETCWLNVRVGSVSEGFKSKTWLIGFTNGKTSLVEDKY